MNIHNIYSDIMLSLANYINHVSPIKIKHFQFNLANTSFILKLSPQFELPSAIINFTSISPWINRPHTFHRPQKNQNQIPVLYNETKDIEIILQEEHHYVNIDFNINCESQIQALTIHHALINWMPLNKPLVFFRFVSFFEIDSPLLNRFLFDVQNDKIQNLFLKHNKYKDSLDYCFSVQYEPIIKLTASSIDLSVLTASSFQVSNSFECFCQLPVNISAPVINFSSNTVPYSRKVNFTNLAMGVADLPYLIIELQNRDSLKLETQLLPIFEIDTAGKFNIDFYYGRVDGVFNIKTTTFNVSLKYNDRVYSCKIIEDYDYLSFTSKYRVIGELSGNLYNVSIFANEIEGWITGYLNLNPINDKLKFNILDIQTDYSINHINITTPDYNILNYSIVVNNTNKITDFILKINPYSVKLNKDNSSISAILLYNNNTSQIDSVLFDSPAPLDGELEFTYNFTSYSLNITTNPDTFITKFNQILPMTDDFQVIAINFNKLEFDYIFGVNQGYIESLNLDFSYNNEVISATTPFENYQKILFGHINIILDSLNYEFDPVTKNYTLIITPDNFFDIDIDNLSWKFIIDKILISSEDELPGILFGKTSSTKNKLKFIISEKLFMSFFNQVNKLNPLYCSFN